MTNQSDFVINTYSISAIPNPLKERLARLMKARHMENSDMPVHDLNYYLQPLNQPEDNEIGLMYALASEEMKDKTVLVGYARLEYRKGSSYNQNYASLQLYVDTEGRDKDCEIRLADAIRQEMPDFIDTVIMSAEKGSDYAKILEKIFHIEKSFEDRHYFSMIRELNIEKLLKLEREAINELKKRGLELIYTNSDAFHECEVEYAQLLEVIWNIGKDSSEHEPFPVERLRGRMQYFTEELNIFMHTFLVKRQSDNSLVAIAETILYGSNPKVSDEAIIGALDEYNDIQIEHALRLKSVILLLQKTDVTHWESASLRLDENNQITTNDRILGFRAGKTFNTYKIPIKKFMI